MEENTASTNDVGLVLWQWQCQVCLVNDAANRYAQLLIPCKSDLEDTVGSK